MGGSRGTPAVRPQEPPEGRRYRGDGCAEGRAGFDVETDRKGRTATLLNDYGLTHSAMALTSIQVDGKTRQALHRLKGRHTYDELFQMLLSLVPQGDEEGRYSDAFRLSLLESEIELRQGRFVTLKDVEAEFGL